MKKKIQRQKLALAKAIFEKLEDFFTGDVDVELADLVLRNVEVIEDELEIINKNPALKAPDDFSKYNDDRIELVKQYADKNEDGTIIMARGGNGDVQMSPEASEKFKEEMVELKAKYAEVLDKIEQINARRDEFMAGDVEIDVYPIPKSLLGKIKSEGKPSGYALTVMSAIRPFLAD